RSEVTNTGNHEGKEVLQLYGSAPEGALDKPAKILLAYAKTKLLQPGENQLVTLTANVNDLASYDDLGVLYKSAYVMEQGEYHFYLGNSVRNTEEIGFIHTEESTRVAEQLTECLAPTSLPKRMRADGSFEELPVRPSHDPDSEGLLTKKEKESIDGVAPDVRFSKGEHLWNNNERRMQFEQVAEGSVTLDEFVAQLSDEELAHLLGGQPNTGVANTFGFGNLPECGIPNFMTADGPAGLRILPECGVCTTAWPCATLLACTWNPEIVYEVGAAGAKEVRENNIAVWLTPAINIHRTPMCGRNFEYYSEDPYLVAKQAGAMVRGIQSQHIAATVKHFALNNKETNRKDSNSRVSERAARQIYLKTFERIVKEAKPWCIMSSYNIVNDYRASENHDLLEKLLRDEWGFEGVVMTDWWTFGEHCKEVNAGNDVKMAAGNPDNLLKALEKGLLKRETMECSVKRLLGVLLKID
ncbi:MAG: beta-glucosidase, partial [Lachnospiraceae bacterium]|nr:beta-glucosidase [Lachnospiraceae bacterium]